MISKAERNAVLEEAAKKSERPGFIAARDTEWDEGVEFAKVFISRSIRAMMSDATDAHKASDTESDLRERLRALVRDWRERSDNHTDYLADELSAALDTAPPREESSTHE